MNRAAQRLFAAFLIVVCHNVSRAQGLQGKATIGGNVAVVTGHSVTLNWNASPNANSYNVYRGIVAGGPYVQIASGIAATAYTDTKVHHGQRLYYVATAVSNNSESVCSNEANVTIP